MSSLYELTSEIEQLERFLDDCEEQGIEFSQAKQNAILDFLDSLEGDRNQKLNGYAYLIRKLESERDAAIAELDAWRQKVASRRNKIDWLKHNLRLHMLAVGQRSIETGKFKFSVCKNGGMPPIAIDESKLPEDLLIQPPPEPNGEAIRMRLAKGENIPGVTILPKGEHVRVK